MALIYIPFSCTPFTNIERGYLKMRMHQVGIVITLHSCENPCTWGISRFLEASDSKRCNGCSLYITCVLLLSFPFLSLSLSPFLSDNKSLRFHAKSCARLYSNVSKLTIKTDVSTKRRLQPVT